MSEEEQDDTLEKKNRRVAFFSTAGIQGALFLMMLLIVAWRAPDPPMPEYGVELNFGLDTEGYGEVQPETPVGNEGTELEDPAPAEQEAVEPEVKKEEVVQKAEPEPAKTKDDIEEAVSEEESPVVVKKKEEPVKPIEKPIEKTIEKPKVEEKKVAEQPKVTPKVDSRAVFNPNDQPATTSGTGQRKEGAKAGQPGNNGDDPGKTGDKGNPQGTLDPNGSYNGTPGGGGGGFSHSGFTGFKFPEVKIPPLPDGAFGTYEFNVKVDDQGEVIAITSERSGLSAEAQRILRDMIQKMILERTGEDVPPISGGKMTFKIVSK